MQHRILEIIEKIAAPSRRFKTMEELTGIASTSWQKVAIGRQRPTEQMIEALCRAYTDCVLWVTTGQTDEGGGQTTIDGHIAKKAHSLQNVLKKEPKEWSSSEAAVVRINLAEALRALETKEKARFVGAWSEALSKYQNGLNNVKDEPENDAALMEAVSTVKLWRDDQETHTNIDHKINLREPLNAANFEWGYHGTGPRELAANVLIHFGIDTEDARLLANDFSQDVISRLNRDRDFISKSEVDLWMRRTGHTVLKKYKA